MTIKVGDKVPSAILMEMKGGAPQPVKTDDLFAGKKVAVFALPGAFTPTCSAKHLPGFIQQADALKAKGVDAIACIAVNDPFVMAAWGKEGSAEGKITMLGDGSNEFTHAVGLELDRVKEGMGMRSQRYSMLVEDGVVKALNVEAPGQYEVSSAEAMLKSL
jgi:glutaredoxin/glutathione-dependent peroxiredoxin